MSNIVKRGFDRDKIQLLKNTVAKGATDSELELFLTLSDKYDLDPFAKEIWFIKYGERSQPMMFTSRDGYLKIAHSSGQFDGMESYTEDDQDGNPIKGVCIVYRKDMSHPFKAEVKFKEYYKPTFKDGKKIDGIWDTYKSAMIMKVAEVFALKRAFSINGLLTQEEMEAPENESIDFSKAIKVCQSALLTDGEKDMLSKCSTQKRVDDFVSWANKMISERESNPAKVIEIQPEEPETDLI